VHVVVGVRPSTHLPMSCPCAPNPPARSCSHARPTQPLPSPALHAEGAAAAVRVVVGVRGSGPLLMYSSRQPSQVKVSPALQP